eukprot:CAMPEP_0181034082 /NCGR_PEP_ID=MMETSP1070-20121207/7620_1 /TAXON_ID=265543 /ORGANISM="Minutocellus polymorphus, Strain NH13" /LENGTH=110 /DNA_ID=CAMNT_0023111591 /DNA_START=39 /DNA_END=368 /DNA_ORIENTATION=+
MMSKRALVTPAAVAAYCNCMISLAAVLLAAVALGPVEAAAALSSQSAVVGPASRRPFPAFFTPPAPATPRQRGNVYNNGVASLGLQSHRQRRHGWFILRLCQSTASLAEP